MLKKFASFGFKERNVRGKRPGRPKTKSEIFFISFAYSCSASLFSLLLPCQEDVQGGQICKCENGACRHLPREQRMIWLPADYHDAPWQRASRRPQDGPAAYEKTELGLPCRSEEMLFLQRRGWQDCSQFTEAGLLCRKANWKWAANVTEFSLSGQKLYLSPILDLHIGYLVSYAMI